MPTAKGYAVVGPDGQITRVDWSRLAVAPGYTVQPVTITTEDVDALRERVAAYEEALTPSPSTKAAYWGENDSPSYWALIKAIMRIIRNRAERREGE